MGRWVGGDRGGGRGRGRRGGADRGQGRGRTINGNQQEAH